MSRSTTCILGAIPTNLLFEYIDLVFPSLTHIIHDSLHQAFSYSLQTTILKKPSLDMNDLKNYHPVLKISHPETVVYLESINPIP